jgi:mannosyltransferase OCH1-like enzyme
MRAHAHAHAHAPRLRAYARDEPAWRQLPVPRVVHQIWAQGCDTLPPRLARWRRRCARLSPGWSFCVWSRAELKAFVATHYPAFSHTFESYRPDIKRIDAARYLLLYHMDADLACLRPLDDFALSAGAVTLSRERNGDLANAFIGASAAHPFLAHLISRLMGACDN